MRKKKFIKCNIILYILNVLHIIYIEDSYYVEVFMLGLYMCVCVCVCVCVATYNIYKLCYILCIMNYISHNI
jgi:hypothetical protein